MRKCPACRKPLSKKYMRSLSPLEWEKHQTAYWMTAWQREVHQKDSIKRELWTWLDQQKITSANIGAIRRKCFVPWSSTWNAIVRDETARREIKSQFNSGHVKHLANKLRWRKGAK